MPFIQLYVEDRILKVWEEATPDHAMMRGRKMHREYKIDWMREIGIYCGVQVLDEYGTITFEGFGCVRRQSKMNEPDFVTEPEWYDDIIKKYRHECIDYSNGL